LFSKVGGWDVILYDQSIFSGSSGTSSSDVRAEWVDAGTWIDVHAEVLPGEPSAERREKLSAFLKTIQITKKE